MLAELPLPIGGLMSDRAAEEVVAALDRFTALFAAEGFANSEPLMTLAFMALPVIPKLKITDRGLVVPPFLTVGDEVRLPVQLVNTTGAAITSTARRA